MRNSNTMVHTIKRYSGIDTININQWADEGNRTESTEPDPHLWDLKHIKGSMHIIEKKMEKLINDTGTISSIMGKYEMRSLVQITFTN